MAENKVLFIVEGEREEVRFIQRLFETCFKTKGYQIYSYSTNIHVLSQLLYNDYPDFDDGGMDIQLALKSKEKDEERRRVLEEKYTDIFMIFDFDPHHKIPHFDTIRRMVKYFNDSTNQGKLFINYPMMESYKHFKRLPDDEFEERIIKAGEIKDYKEIVDKNSSFRNLDLFTYAEYYSMAVHQLRKCRKILRGEYVIPEAEEYYTWDLSEVYEKELKNLEEGYVDVLNTCILILVDYSPSKFFRYIKEHEKELMI